jgi:predicted deacetylase
MIPHPAQYLLRFDDLCPTLDVSRWQRFRSLIEEFNLHPILAVVPDNWDGVLKLSPPAPGFWAEMRSMQAIGATIGLHGYHHRCIHRGVSLLQLHRHSEFSGMLEETQQQWISDGIAILRSHGLNPKIWVAPNHGFDRATLRALRAEGISTLSDGFARVPFIRYGLTWIPQQIWEPVDKSKGLWTICLHSNFCSAAKVSELHAFVRAHAAQFTSVDHVLTELLPTQLSLFERLYEACAFWRVKAHRARKRGKRGFCGRSNG